VGRPAGHAATDSVNRPRMTPREELQWDESSGYERNALRDKASRELRAPPHGAYCRHD